MYNNVLLVFVRDLNTDSTVTMDSDFHNNNLANKNAGKKRRMVDDNQQAISQVWENFFFNKVVWFKLMNEMKGLWVIQRANGEHLFSTRVNVKVMLKKQWNDRKCKKLDIQCSCLILFSCLYKKTIFISSFWEEWQKAILNYCFLC